MGYLRHLEGGQPVRPSPHPPVPLRSGELLGPVPSEQDQGSGKACVASPKSQFLFENSRHRVTWSLCELRVRGGCQRVGEGGTFCQTQLRPSAP